MKENIENIDLLINENTDRQLSTVDWDQLYCRIQKQLDRAKKPKDAASRRRNLFRWAVGISSAAAILLVLFTLMDGKDTMIPLPPGQQAVVKVTEHQIAQCNVTIIDHNGHTEKENEPRPSWVILKIIQPAPSENQTDKNLLDIACLL